MAQITIAGVVRTTTPMAFRQWRNAWTALQRAQTEGIDDMEAVDLMIVVVSAALERAELPTDRLTPDQIRDALAINEIPNIQAVIPAILAENGFDVGEPRGVGERPTAPSTGTSTD